MSVRESNDYIPDLVELMSISTSSIKHYRGRIHISSKSHIQNHIEDLINLRQNHHFTSQITSNHKSSNHINQNQNQDHIFNNPFILFPTARISSSIPVQFQSNLQFSAVQSIYASLLFSTPFFHSSLSYFLSYFLSFSLLSIPLSSHLRFIYHKYQRYDVIPETESKSKSKLSRSNKKQRTKGRKKWCLKPTHSITSAVRSFMYHANSKKKHRDKKRKTNSKSKLISSC